VPILRIEIPDDLHQRIDLQKPEYLDRKGFVCLILDQALDKGSKLTERAPASAGEGGGSVVSSSSITSNKTNSLKDKSIYPNLEQHTELIRMFWRVKKGSKSDQGWKLLNTELTKIQETYGDTVVHEQLELAINGLWKGVSLRLYEQYLPKGQVKAPPRQKRTEEEINAQSQADFEKFWEEMNNAKSQ